MNIQAPELGLRLAKALGSYGPVQLGSVEEVVFPVVVLDDLRPQATRRRRYGMTFDQAAVIGQQSQAWLINPQAGQNNVRVYLRHAMVGGAQSGTHWAFWGIDTGGAPGISNLGRSLEFTNTRGVAGTATSSSAAPSINSFFASLGSNVFIPAEFVEGIVLQPGDNLSVLLEDQNARLVGGFIWEEEPIP